MPDRAAIPAGSTGIAGRDGIAIGAYRADEADACAAIFERAFNAGHPYAARPVSRADFLAAIERRDVLVARLSDGTPAGSASVVRGLAFINHLYVDPVFAGRGIGRELLARDGNAPRPRRNLARPAPEPAGTDTVPGARKMTDRRAFLLAVAAVSLFAPAARAQAPARIAPYTDAAFAAAQAAGRPILVAVEAPWCPTCRAQKPILGALLARPGFADMVALSVDFDSQKDAVRKLGARMQSTLVVFRGTAELGRSVGDTNAASIEALLAKAV